MAGMSDRKIAEWKQRLNHADRYWKDKGLSGEKGAQGDGEFDAFEFLNFYRGKQWGDYGGWGGFNQESLITVNVTAANTHAMISRLSKRNPEVIVTPKKKGADQSGRARRNQLVLNYFLKELKMKREVDKCLRDALLTPFGICEHIFTPHIEKFTKDGEELEIYSMARPDLPGIRRRAFWDVRMDPLAESWHPDGTCRWVAFRDLLSMDQIRAHPKYTKPHDLRPTKSVELLETQKRRARGRTDEAEEWYQLVEVWRIYDKTTRTYFAMSPGSDKLLLEPSDWPIPWESLPYSYLAFNEQSDTNVPLPFPALYMSQQVELNKNRTLMAELVKRLRRLIMAQRQGFTEEDRRKIETGDISLQEVFFVDGQLGDVLREIGIGGFDQTLLLYDAKIKEDIREQIGMSQMDRAQRINVETASEANSVQAGSDIQAGRNEATFEDFWVDIVRTFHQALRYTLTDEILVPVVGLADRQKLETDEDFITINKDDIQGEFNFDIRVGSTLPKDHDREFAKALQLQTIYKDNATVDQQGLTRLVFEESGFDSSEYVRSPEQIQATEEMLAMRGQGGPPGGKPASNGSGGLDANFLRGLNPQGAA